MIKRTDKLRRICLWAGIGLLAAAAVVLGLWQWNIHAAAEKSAYYVDAIRDLTPAPQDALLEERRDNTMSALAIDGTDFIGLLELPQYGCALPVCADWGAVEQYPCRLEGSVYDRSIRIGATTQAGQFEFYQQISVGDRVTFTDMEGNRYTYAVTDIRYARHADQAALTQRDAALVLFIKNTHALEYLLLYCTPLG